ncbi:hypothetical protein QTG56_25985 (plasmid) [Rossellomorea sp. AcN35-11]|nr:hypothetical protein [Rossellomorea aquimaris]WJV32068.1 hypothetical protein QTG56_25985 [Rossellomorea sp. AcN35-11]
MTEELLGKNLGDDESGFDGQNIYVQVNIEEGLEANTLILYGTVFRDETNPLASIVDLDIDIKMQKRLMEYGLRPDGNYNIQSGRTLILKEGKFSWDPTEMEYVKVKE